MVYLHSALLLLEQLLKLANKHAGNLTAMKKFEIGLQLFV